MIFLSAQEPPKLPPLIEIVIEKPKEEEKQEEPITWESNPNNCNEDTQWIAAEEPFYCIDKPGTAFHTPQIQTTNTQAVRGSYSVNWYPKGQCTWLVASMRPVGAWNSASDWLWQAQRDGWATGSTPRPGAIAWRYGHVAYVVSVNGSNMVVKEANYDYRGSIRTIEVPVSSYAKFIY